MTSETMDCPDIRISLGVYVLGAIDPAEREMVDSHLETCGDCRAELAELAGLPALLDRISKEEAIGLADFGDSPFPLAGVQPPEPPRELLATVHDLTAARRRRRRWRNTSLATVAAAVVAVGVFGGVQLGSHSAQPAASAQQQLYLGPQNGAMHTVTGRSGNMTATVSYSQMGWGTALDTLVTGIPEGTNCQLIVIDSHGDRHLAGNWVTDNLEGTVNYPGSVGLSAQDIVGFEVTVGSSAAIHIKA